jgi:non-ribosomal peptide synthase protein (TIGR01720 family)
MDLSVLPSAEQDAAIEMAACRLRRSLNLADGPVMQVLYFDLGVKRPSRLLFIFHHLVCDIYSLQLLAADFQTAYLQLAQNQAVKLTPKTTSYKAWSEKLLAYARSSALCYELEYWLSLPWQQTICVPLDCADETANTVASTCSRIVSLHKNETETLLKAYPGELLPVLLTVFGQMLENWTTSPCVLFTLIINGREPIFDDIDVSRTVGLFALGHPVILDMRGAQSPADRLSLVKGQVMRIPNRGITHGILHLSECEYIKDKLGKLDEATCRHKVVFNFIPPLGSELPEEAPFRPLRSVIDLGEDSTSKRDYVLKCTASIVHGQLVFNWEYSTNLHRSDTIETLAQFYLAALRNLLH